MTLQKPMWTQGEHEKVCTDSNLSSGSKEGLWDCKEVRFPTFYSIDFTSIKNIISEVKCMKTDSHSLARFMVEATDGLQRLS